MERTTDSILDAIESASRNREVWDALTYLEAATSLNALRGNESDLLADLYQAFSKKKLALLEEGKTAAYAKIAIDTSEEYRAYLRQKSKCERIEETIRLAKKMAAMKGEEMRTNQ